MTRRLRPTIVFILFACGIIGCNTATREQELQQQKLLTELAKTNTESLAEMSKKQAELRNRELELIKKDEKFNARENAIQESLGQVKKQEESLRKRESTTTQREREVAQKIAAEETRIQEEKDVFSKERERLNVARSQVQAIAKQQEAERLARQAAIREQEAVQRGHEERQSPEVLSRIKRRQPDLDELIDLATNLALKRHPDLVRTSVRKQLSTKFDRDYWGTIQEDDEFAKAASDVAYKCLFEVCRGGYQSEYGTEHFAITTKWRDAFITKHEASKK